MFTPDDLPIVGIGHTSFVTNNIIISASTFLGRYREKFTAIVAKCDPVTTSDLPNDHLAFNE